MQINGLPGIFSTSLLFPRSGVNATAGEDVRRRQLISAYRHVLKLQKALAKIKPTLFLQSRSVSSALASASSTSPLSGLASGTPTVLTSTGEINATPTSFSPFGPDWTGSTAAAGLSGVYDGSNGTDTLTFEVTRAGVHGEDDIDITVSDGGGSPLETISIGRNDPLDQQYTLANGMIFTLGAGQVVKNDRFTVDVVDSDPTSYSPANPAWEGSTALTTIAGVYDGSNGTATLTVTVNRGGTHGEDDLQLKVEDDQGGGLDTINIGRNDPLDQQYSLSNGLVLTLGSGSLLKDTTFTVNVNDTVGSAVDPDKPFDGVRNDNPNFEFGLGVTAGAFELNGVTIDVFANDTINAVLARITQSAAGVTATFDSGTEVVLLTQKTTGSLPTITVANDTSGFVTATKLATATPTPGVDDDADRPLDQVAQFSSVSSGTIQVNGVDISIDASTDSLSDVLARISASSAGVSATLDESLRQVTIVSQNSQAPLVLDSGGTGLFPALSIADGTYDPAVGSAREEGVPRSRRDSIASILKDVADSLNALFGEGDLAQVGRVNRFRKDLERAVSKSFDSEGPRFRSDVGIHFDFRRSADEVFDLGLSRRRQVRSALGSHSGTDQMRELFFGARANSKGLIERLREVAKEIESDLEQELGSSGINVDVIG